MNTVFGASAADLLDVPVSIFMNGGSFTGSDLDDVIRTSEFAETVNGGDGNDHILGGVNLDTGPDLLQGGDGNDTIEARGGVSNALYSDGQGGTGTVLEPNVMEGGAGDDLLVSTHSNIMTGGEGADIFALDRPSAAAPSEITDFNEDEDEDVIYIDNPSGGRSQPDGVEINVWDDGNGADLVVDNVVVARINGGQNLAVEDIRLTRSGISIDLLGNH